MVGFPSITKLLRNDALNNLIYTDHISSVDSYNAASDKIETVESNDYMEPEKGYWIFANYDCVWEVPI
jgi:hypothetical protein